MLDTYILDIPKGYYRIVRHDMFSPSTEKMHLDRTFYRKYVNNPTAEDKRSGKYKPKLLIYKRGAEATLRIEASAAKVINNNNLIEITENDFDLEVAMLQEKVSSMGVSVAENVIRRAIVASFHPSKNILITGGYSATGIIKEFEKINLTEKMDLQKTTFRNGGHGLQYYSKSHSLVFYDKMKDLEKSENKAIDVDQKIQRQSLFDFLERKAKPEILRMEVRLSEKPKMNAVLARLGFAQNPTFSDIFKLAVCQKILLDYFQTYIEPSLFIFDFEDTPQKILRMLFKNNPKMRTATIFQLALLKMACKDKGGVKDLRQMLGKRASKRSWDRIGVKIKLLNKTAIIENCHEYIKQIKTALQQFKPYALPQAAKIEPPKDAFDPMSLH